MGRSLIRTGLVAAASLFALAAMGGIGQQTAPGAVASGTFAPGAWGSSAWAGEREAKPRRRARRQARRRAPEGSSPEEIARYFQLYGGFIDPNINKQSQAGPFDSGFFFDSGLGPNGGDSPYMN